MEKNLFTQNIDRDALESVKWGDEIELLQSFRSAGQSSTTGEDTSSTLSPLGLGIADTDYPVFPAIVEALTQRSKISHYGYVSDSVRTKKSIQDWTESRDGYRPEIEEVISFHGVLEAIAIAILSLTQPGDSILILEPAYPPFLKLPLALGRKIETLEVTQSPNASPSLPWEQLQKRSREWTKENKPKILLWSNPHNPLGHVYSLAEIEQWMEFCREHDIFLISDEIHMDLTYPEAPQSSIAKVWAKQGAHKTPSAIVSAASKTFNIAGLSYAYGIFPDSIIRAKIEPVRFGIGLYRPNSFGMLATRIAFEEGKEYVQAQKEFLSSQSQFLQDFLHHHIKDLQISPQNSMFLCWIRWKEEKNQASLPAEARVQNWSSQLQQWMSATQVYVIDGKHFYFHPEAGIAKFRLNFACSRDRLQEVCERWKQYFQHQK